MNNFFDFITEFKPMLTEGFTNTIIISFYSLILATIIGFILAILRTSSIFIINKTINIVTEFIRGIPALIILSLMLFCIPADVIKLSIFHVAIIALGIANSCYISDTLRLQIKALSQTAGEEKQKNIITRQSTSPRQNILPLAIYKSLPAYMNNIITVVKDSSLASFFTVLELTRTGNQLMALTFMPLTVFAVITALYVCINLPLSFIMSVLDKRINKA